MYESRKQGLIWYLIYWTLRMVRMERTRAESKAYDCISHGDWLFGNTFVNAKPILRGPWKGGIARPINYWPMYRVEKADGHRAIVFGKKLESVPGPLVWWMTIERPAFFRQREK